MGLVGGNILGIVWDKNRCNHFYWDAHWANHWGRKPAMSKVASCLFGGKSEIPEGNGDL